MINIQIVDWNVQNWITWQSDNPSSWIVWENKFIIKMDTLTNKSLWNKIDVPATNNTSTSSTTTKTNDSSTSQTSSVVIQSIVGAVAGVTVVFSICNLSTPQGVWITMNQFQLILLLLLTNSHIPQSVVDYLSGLKATTCSLNFVPFKDIPGIKTIINWLDFGLENNDLKHFGLLSGSTFVNNFSLVWVVSLIAVVHLCFSLCHSKLKRKTKDRPKWRSLFNCCSYNIPLTPGKGVYKSEKFGKFLFQKYTPFPL